MLTQPISAEPTKAASWYCILTSATWQSFRTYQKLRDQWEFTPDDVGIEYCIGIDEAFDVRAPTSTCWLTWKFCCGGANENFCTERGVTELRIGELDT